MALVLRNSKSLSFEKSTKTKRKSGPKIVVPATDKRTQKSGANGTNMVPQAGKNGLKLLRDIGQSSSLKVFSLTKELLFEKSYQTLSNKSFDTKCTI